MMMEEEDGQDGKRKMFGFSVNVSRRKAVMASVAVVSAELLWQKDVARAVAAQDTASILPAGTLERIEAGKAVIIPNWLSADE